MEHKLWTASKLTSTVLHQLLPNMNPPKTQIYGVDNVEDSFGII